MPAMKRILIKPVSLLYDFGYRLVTLPENRLSILSGVLLFIAFPPFGVGWVIFVSLIPFLIAIQGKSWSENFRVSILSSVVFYIGLLYWIIPITLSGFLATLLALCVYTGIVVILTTLCRNRFGEIGWLSFPFLYGSMEWLRSLGIMGFPWANLGYALGEYNSLIQIAAVTGVGGLSFWILLTNTLGFLAIIRRDTRLIIGWGIFLIITLSGLSLFGSMEKNRLHEVMEKFPEMRVSLTQGNVDQDEKWSEDFLHSNLDIYERLSRIADRQDPDLIVWPETAVTCYITSPSRREFLLRIFDVYRQVQTPIICGSLDYKIKPEFQQDPYSRRYHAYSSAFYFDSERPTFGLPRYHKNRLVPFAEWIPLSDRIPILKKLQFGQGDFTPDTHIQLFTHPKGYIGIFICFESVFPRYLRKIVNIKRDKPLYLINVTNDAWFGRSSAPFQHASLVKFRAIETRTGLGRSANTGISLIYNPLGEIDIGSGIFHEGTFTGQVYPNIEESFFLKHGDLFDQSIFGIAIFWLLSAGIASLAMTNNE